MKGEGLTDEIIFDPDVMNSVMKEGEFLVLRIREEIEQLGMYRTGIKKEQEAIARRLLLVCRGYEVLLRYLKASSNTYSSVVSAAEELVNF